jgi:hypothetical protein
MQHPGAVAGNPWRRGPFVSSMLRRGINFFPAPTPAREWVFGPDVSQT